MTATAAPALLPTDELEVFDCGHEAVEGGLVFCSLWDSLCQDCREEHINSCRVCLTA